MVSSVIYRSGRPDIDWGSRNSHSIFDACFESVVEKQRLIGEMGSLVVGCDKDPFDFVVAKPSRVDCCPILGDHVYSREFGKLLRLGAIGVSSETDYSVLRETFRLGKDFSKVLQDSTTSVSCGSDD